MSAGSGDDDKTNTESKLDGSYMTSEGACSFFDPPIENYRNIYGSNRPSYSRQGLPDTGQPANTFFRMRRLKLASQTSGLGGTGNYGGTENTDTENNTENNVYFNSGAISPQQDGTFSLL